MRLRCRVHEFLYVKDGNEVWVVGLTSIPPIFSYSSIPTILIIIPVGLLHYSHKRQIIPAYKVINRQL